jgi:hypothetical protein
MPKNRTIYNALALYAGQVNATGMQTGLGDVLQLSRVQSFDEDFTRNFTDVNQFGNLAAIDRVEVEAPEVTANFSYYLTNGFNDHAIGLAVAPIFYPSIDIISCISGLLSRQTDEKNYYLLIADEGSDSVGFNSNNSGVLGIGNAYLASYSINAAVGDIATAEIEVQGLNLAVYKNRTNTSGYLLPSINPVIGTKIENNYFILPPAISASGIPSVLLPGDINMSIPTNGVLGFENTDLKIQDFNLSFDLNRTPLQKIGNRFSFSREIDFPVTATLELTAEVGDLKSGNLVDLLCEKSTQNFTIEMKEPGCGQNKSTALLFIFRGVKLTSQSFTSAIGDNASMTASYEVQLGGIQDKTKGIFISGSYYEDCPTVGNRPHFLIGGYGITNNGGKYYTKIGNNWSFNNSVFPPLRTGTFFANGDIRLSVTGTSMYSSSWNGFTNVITGWSPNTGWMEFSPGSFIALTRSGSTSSFSTSQINWYSTSKNPNTLSASEKLFTSPVFNTFTLLHTVGFSNNTWRETGNLSALGFSPAGDSLIGYLPPNDRYLFFSTNAAPGNGAVISISGSTSGYYNITPSLDGSCPNVSNFTVTY